MASGRRRGYGAKGMSGRLDRHSGHERDGADLHQRLAVGEVGDIGRDPLGVGREALLESLDAVEIKVAYGDKGRRLAGRAAGDPLIYRDGLTGVAQAFADDVHMLLAVIVEVEMHIGLVGVQHTDLNHLTFLMRAYECVCGQIRRSRMASESLIGAA